MPQSSSWSAHRRATPDSVIDRYTGADGADASTGRTLEVPARAPDSSGAGIPPRHFACIRPAQRLLALAALLLVPGLAQADVITQYKEIVGKKTNFQDSTSLSFDQYQSVDGLRSLSEVTIHIEQTLRTHVTIPKPPKGAVITVNVGTADDPAELRTLLPFDLPIDAAGSELVTDLPPIEVTWSWQDGHAYTNDWTETSTWSGTYSNPAVLALFTGDETFSLASTGAALSRYQSSTGSGGALIMTHADVRVWVDYRDVERTIRSVVPEPSSAILTGSGAIALGLFARRRARRRR